MSLHPPCLLPGITQRILVLLIFEKAKVSCIRLDKTLWGREDDPTPYLVVEGLDTKDIGAFEFIKGAMVHPELLYVLHGIMVLPTYIVNKEYPLAPSDAFFKDRKGFLQIH